MFSPLCAECHPSCLQWTVPVDEWEPLRQQAVQRAASRTAERKAKKQASKGKR